MTYFLSPTEGFLSDTIHAEIPSDAVRLTDEQYDALKGQRIVWDAKGKPSVFDPSTDKDTILVAIAQRRYQAETAGISLGGMQVDTGRDSQGLINGAALSAFMDDTYTCNWKAADGFVKLDAKTILAVARAVRNHVQTCFDREAELVGAVQGGTYKPAMLDQGWPA